MKQHEVQPMLDHFTTTLQKWATKREQEEKWLPGSIFKEIAKKAAADPDSGIDYSQNYFDSHEAMGQALRTVHPELEGKYPSDDDWPDWADEKTEWTFHYFRESLIHN